MNVCIKVLVECHLKCGIVFERETNDQHDREICPLRKKQCQYCKQEVQVNKENKHIRKCADHPDTEVPCPYKELGCNVITLRKDKNIHLTENMIGHQKLMLEQLSQLRNRNQQLEQLNEQQKNRIGTIDRSTTEIERQHRGELDELVVHIKKVDRKWKWPIIFPIIVSVITLIMAVTICIPVAVSIEDQHSQSSIQQIQSSIQQIKSNFELIQSVMGNVEYIYDYIEARGRVLQGIEWIHYLDTNTNSGPILYLERCKLQLYAQSLSYSENEVNAQYFVYRMKGEYDDELDSCEITYTKFMTVQAVFLLQRSLVNCSCARLVLNRDGSKSSLGCGVDTGYMNTVGSRDMCYISRYFFNTNK